MIKVDHVLVNRLEKLSLISFDTGEREKLREEIIETLQFIGDFEGSHRQDPLSTCTLVKRLEHLSPDVSTKVRFPFFDNVCEQEEGYVIVSTE